MTAYGGVWPSAITIGGPGYVAVGRESPCCADVGYDDDPWQTAIWTSPDGRVWELVPDLDTFGKSGLNGVATDPNGTILAVGYDVLAPSADDPRNLFVEAASAWRSTNGVDWTRIEGIAGDALRDVLATPRGWVVAGAVADAPALFSSTDGMVWTTRTFDGSGTMERLAVSDDGTAVAIGCIARDREAVCESKAFASTDDATWTEANTTMVFARDVAWWHDRFIAIGTNDESTAARAWMSRDGLEWVGGPDVLRSVAGSIDVLVVDGDRLIGAGSRLSGDPPSSRPSIWQTVDGAAWEPLAQLADPKGAASGQVTAALATDEALLVMGNAFVIPGGRPCVWIGER